MRYQAAAVAGIQGMPRIASVRAVLVENSAMGCDQRL
jgi:hypothetical protein